MTLVVPRRRVWCEQCGGPHLERLSWLGRYQRVTDRLAEAVSQLLESSNILAVARFFQLGWHTVKALDKALLRRGDPRAGLEPDPLPSDGRVRSTQGPSLCHGSLSIRSAVRCYGSVMAARAETPEPSSNNCQQELPADPGRSDRHDDGPMSWRSRPTAPTPRSSTTCSTSRGQVRP
ncbi:putative transposase for insertion sequence element IS1001 [Bordetella holmesii 1058]|uniref:Transposase for insertion sequence element IS1001 n=1 Tax=Bordetella holmesii 1058 TaxID=1247648 RepID=A0ABP3BMN2_9BORD|nr:putative transposase for insertion sequence element IS1001 [Bordetella holmesii 1058]